MMKPLAKVSFKAYEQHQSQLFPSSLDEWIPKNHVEDCVGCTLREQCHKSQYNRRIEIGVKQQEYRKKARELLLSPKGLDHRSRRPIEPEAAFDRSKQIVSSDASC